MRNYQLEEVYTARDVARICGISEGRVRYWRAKHRRGPGHRLNFEDLVAWAESELIGARLNGKASTPFLELNDHVYVAPGVRSPLVGGAFTEGIAARHAAGESREDLAIDLDLTMEQIDAAIQWEAR